MRFRCNRERVCPPCTSASIRDAACRRTAGGAGRARARARDRDRRGARRLRSRETISRGNDRSGDVGRDGASRARARETRGMENEQRDGQTVGSFGGVLRWHAPLPPRPPPRPRPRSPSATISLAKSRPTAEMGVAATRRGDANAPARAANARGATTWRGDVDANAIALRACSCEETREGTTAAACTWRSPDAARALVRAKRCRRAGAHAGRRLVAKKSALKIT